MMTQRSLATSAIECARLLIDLCAQLNTKECGTRTALSQPAVEDQSARYKIWAGNLGAFQRLPSTSCLDYRVRESPKVATQIQELLEDLRDALQDVSAIASGERPNRVAESDGEDDEFEDEAGIDSDDDGNEDEDKEQDISEQDSDGSQAGFDEEIEIDIDADGKRHRLSEAEERLESVKDTITSLFRMSIIIRKASPRDRFARALATRQEPFDDRFDIDHVSHKFPILNDREWLKERVGKAITQRRQYLRYARDHRDKLAKEPQDLWQPEDVGPKLNLLPGAGLPVLSQAGKTYLPKPTSTLAPTAASTLHLDGVLVQETNFQDTQSQTSYAVSLGEGDDESCLQLPSLAEVSKDANTFECPLCWTIQDIGKESTWRKHGFADLKPYICTFEDCDVKLFSDRREWFEHELLYHRAQWHCAFCGRDDFRSIKAFQDHVHSRHMQSMTDVQLDALSEASRRFVDRVPALDCPFCHEWEAKLRQANPDIPASEVVVVTPIQFRHHVGAHMQQLALFSIPRGFLEDNADAKSVASLGSPRSNGAGLRKAEMALQYGSPEDIQNEIQNLLKRPQNNAEVHSLLGKCYYKIGNRGLAFTHDRRARDLRASPQREETETDHSTKASVDDRINWSTDDKEVSDSYVENDEEMIMVTDAPSVYHWLISLFQDLNDSLLVEKVPNTGAHERLAADIARLVHVRATVTQSQLTELFLSHHANFDTKSDKQTVSVVAFIWKHLCADNSARAKFTCACCEDDGVFVFDTMMALIAHETVQGYACEFCSEEFDHPNFMTSEPTTSVTPGAANVGDNRVQPGNQQAATHNAREDNIDETSSPPPEDFRKECWSCSKVTERSHQLMKNWKDDGGNCPFCRSICQGMHQEMELVPRLCNVTNFKTASELKTHLLTDHFVTEQWLDILEDVAGLTEAEYQQRLQERSSTATDLSSTTKRWTCKKLAERWGQLLRPSRHTVNNFPSHYNCRYCGQHLDYYADAMEHLTIVHHYESCSNIEFKGVREFEEHLSKEHAAELKNPWIGPLEKFACSEERYFNELVNYEDTALELPAAERRNGPHPEISDDSPRVTAELAQHHTGHKEARQVRREMAGDEESGWSCCNCQGPQGPNSLTYHQVCNLCGIHARCNRCPVYDFTGKPIASWSCLDLLKLLIFGVHIIRKTGKTKYACQYCGLSIPFELASYHLSFFHKARDGCDHRAYTDPDVFRDHLLAEHAAVAGSWLEFLERLAVKRSLAYELLDKENMGAASPINNGNDVVHTEPTSEVVDTESAREAENEVAYLCLHCDRGLFDGPSLDEHVEQVHSMGYICLEKTIPKPGDESISCEDCRKRKVYKSARAAASHQYHVHNIPCLQERGRIGLVDAYIIPDFEKWIMPVQLPVTSKTQDVRTTGEEAEDKRAPETESLTEQVEKGQSDGQRNNEVVNIDHQESIDSRGQRLLTFFRKHGHAVEFSSKDRLSFLESVDLGLLYIERPFERHDILVESFSLGAEHAIYKIRQLVLACDEERDYENPRSRIDWRFCLTCKWKWESYLELPFCPRCGRLSIRAAFPDDIDPVDHSVKFFDLFKPATGAVGAQEDEVNFGISATVQDRYGMSYTTTFLQQLSGDMKEEFAQHYRNGPQFGLGWPVPPETRCSFAWKLFDILKRLDPNHSNVFAVRNAISIELRAMLYSVNGEEYRRYIGRECADMEKEIEQGFLGKEDRDIENVHDVQDIPGLESGGAVYQSIEDAGSQLMTISRTIHADDRLRQASNVLRKVPKVQRPQLFTDLIDGGQLNSVAAENRDFNLAALYIACGAEIDRLLTLFEACQPGKINRKTFIDNIVAEGLLSPSWWRESLRMRLREWALATKDTEIPLSNAALSAIKLFSPENKDTNTPVTNIKPDEFIFKISEAFTNQQYSEVKALLGGFEDKNASAAFLNNVPFVWGKFTLPMILIAENGCIPLAEILVRYGANVDIQSGLGETPLSIAIGKNQEIFVYWLLRHGAQIADEKTELKLRHYKELMAIDQQGYNWWELMGDMEHEPDNLTVVRSLLHSAKPFSAFRADVVHPVSYQRAIDVTAEHGNVAMAQLLVEHGADLHYHPFNKDEPDNTPLWRALAFQQLDFIEYLFENGFGWHDISERRDELESVIGLIDAQRHVVGLPRLSDRLGQRPEEGTTIYPVGDVDGFHFNSEIILKPSKARPALPSYEPIGSSPDHEQLSSQGKPSLVSPAATTSISRKQPPLHPQLAPLGAIKYTDIKPLRGMLSPEEVDEEVSSWDREVTMKGTIDAYQAGITRTAETPISQFKGNLTQELEQALRSSTQALQRNLWEGEKAREQIHLLADEARKQVINSSSPHTPMPGESGDINHAGGEVGEEENRPSPSGEKLFEGVKEAKDD